MSTGLDWTTYRTLEEGERYELKKIDNLRNLSSVASINTGKKRELERLVLTLETQLKALPQDTNTEEKIEINRNLQNAREILSFRQQRSAALLRRRTALQDKEKAAHLKSILDSLTPANDQLNHQRKMIFDEMIRFLENIKKAKKEAQEKNKRRYAAKLHQWESKITLMLASFDQFLLINEDLLD